MERFSDELHDFHVGKCDLACERKNDEKLLFSCVNATNQGTNIAFFNFEPFMKDNPIVVMRQHYIEHMMNVMNTLNLLYFALSLSLCLFIVCLFTFFLMNSPLEQQC